MDKSSDEFNILNSLTEKQREYILFLKFYELDDYNERKKLKEFCDNLGINVYKSYIKASILNRDTKYLDFNELNLAKDNYKTILVKTKQLARELNLTNSLAISNLFTYLLWNGYFSINKSLKYESSDRHMIDLHYSFDIMNGVGVCLNFSDMLTDFLNEFNYNAANIINIFDTETKKDYSPQIQRNITKNKLSFNLLASIIKPITNIVGNHVFTLINEPNGSYIYDPTNLMIFNLDDTYTATNVCGTGKSLIKPYFSYFINDSSKALDALASLNMSTFFDAPYLRKDFIFNWENGILYFNKNKNLLDDFHDEINHNIEYISNNLNNIKMLSKQYKKNKTTSK